jgi:3-oxoadipate CoA-transferase alpha subunit
MIDKFHTSAADALGHVEDGSTVLIGGFGAVGQPLALIDGLIENGARDLTIVANNAGVGREGLARLLELRRVRKVICSFPRSSDPVVFEELYNAGLLELEIVPQGTLAERMRAAGAGIPAFFTPTAVGTALAGGKETRTIDGREHVHRTGRSLAGGPLGKPDLPPQRPQLQPGHGHRRRKDDRPDAAHGRAWCARP